MPEIAASFGKPFDLQLAALRLRLANLLGTVAWDDLVKSQHDRAFVVAGAMKADLLADLGRAVEKAIAEHRSIETFRAEFRKIVEDRGWHGWTGEGTAKGEAWRTKVIYRTNMATSYAAGRMAQLKAGNFKFWVYKHGLAVEPRLQHLAWDGVALAPDHPFWATHAPPNGWGCTCRVLGTNSPAGVKRVGGDPDKQLPPGWDATNAKTGEPVGIDKGWGYSPGASVAQELAAVSAKLENLPRPLAVDLIGAMVNRPPNSAANPLADWLRNPAGNYPIARLPQADVDALRAKVSVLHLSAETMGKQGRKHPEISADDYAEVQVTIDLADYRLNDKEPGSEAMRRIFIRDHPDLGYVVVVKATLSGEGLFLLSLRKLSASAAKRKSFIEAITSRALMRTTKAGEEKK